MDATLRGQWIPEDFLVEKPIRIDLRPDGKCVGEFYCGEQNGLPLYGHLVGKLADNGTRFKGYWTKPPAHTAAEEKHNLFDIVMDADGASWTGSYKMKGGSGGQWKARQAEKLRRAGSRLSVRGVAKDRAVFERLVRPSSAKADRESRRRQLLRESITRFEKSAAGSLDVEGPFTTVGDPYDDSALARHQRNSRHTGLQFAVGKAQRDTKMEHLPDPYIDAAALARKLRKQQREKTTRPRDERPGFFPSSARADRDLNRDVYLTVPELVDADAAKVRELAHKCLEEDKRRRVQLARHKAAAVREGLTGGGHRPASAQADSARPPFYPLSASGPLSKQRHVGLVADPEDPAIPKPAKPSRGQVRPQSARPPASSSSPRSPPHATSKPPFYSAVASRGQRKQATTIALTESATNAPVKARHRPQSAPVRPRSAAGSRAEGHPPPFIATAGPPGGREFSRLTHMPDPVPEKVYRRPSKEEGPPPFFPPQRGHTRWVRSVALDPINLRRVAQK